MLCPLVYGHSFGNNVQNGIDVMSMQIQEEFERIGKTIEEYESLIGSSVDKNENQVDWSQVHEVLETEAAWTHGGANHIVRLVRDNGAFVLRNACALAVVLGYEDGALGL